MAIEVSPERAETLAQEAILRLRLKRRPRPDPVAFAVRCGLEQPDPWQAALLRSDARQMLLNCSRQSGKSTISAILACDEAVHRPLNPVLLLAPTLRQSRELFLKVKDALRASGMRVQDESAERIVLANGGRIVCLPGNEATVRGFSGVGLLVVDEASRVSDQLYYAVRPMLAVSGGRIVLLSTPFGRRGFFHAEWTSGGEDWHRVEVTAAQCPRIPREWLDRERDVIGQWWYDQEYGCQFVDTTDAVFRYEDIQAAYDEGVEPLELPVFVPAGKRRG